MKRGHNAKTFDQRPSCRSCEKNHPTAMHGYISKEKIKADCSSGKTGDKTISNNFVDQRDNCHTTGEFR